MNNIIVNRHWHDWTWSISNLPSFTLDGNCVRLMFPYLQLHIIWDELDRGVFPCRVGAALLFVWVAIYWSIVQKIIRGQTKSDCSLWDNCKQKWNCSVIYIRFVSFTWGIFTGNVPFYWAVFQFALSHPRQIDGWNPINF